MKIELAILAAAVALSLGGYAQAQDATTAAGLPTSQSAGATAPPAPHAANPASVSQPAPALPAGIDPPPEGKGQVVFFRPSRFLGMALTFTVRENNMALGSLPNAHYFVQVADPGIHAYEIGHNDTIHIEVEAGVTYYAMQSTQMGIIAGRAVLSPSDQATFETALPHMHLSAPIEQGH